jgi:hypothetical protein
LARGFVSLPSDAPRAVLMDDPPVNSEPRYPHMEWAYANGYSKKYMSSGWASFERHFVTWAEAEGYSLDIISQTDLHYRPDLIDGYACIALVGHDEYWSWEMRDAIDAYVARGGHVARFAGNFMWQIRLEDEGRRQVCYKYIARDEDPLMHGGPRHLVTESWEAPEIGRPGAAIWMGGIDVDAHGGSVPRAIAAAGGKHWSPHFRNVTAERLAEAHALGLRVYPWTGDDPADMKTLIAMGVDGITTDRPDLLREVLVALGRLKSPASR